MRKNHTLIVVGMAYVRQIKTTDLSYKDFSTKLLNYVLNSGKYASQIDVVFDVYKENSIKDVERTRRSSGDLVLKQIVSTSKIKQWHQLLSSGDFQNKLVSYLADDWKLNTDLLNGRMLFVTSGADAFEITTTSCRLVTELISSGRRYTNAVTCKTCQLYAYEDVIIATPDTDVFLIALSHLSSINAHVYMLTGTNEKGRLI